MSECTALGSNGGQRTDGEANGTEGEGRGSGGVRSLLARCPLLLLLSPSHRTPQPAASPFTLHAHRCAPPSITAARRGVGGQWASRLAKEREKAKRRSPKEKNVRKPKKKKEENKHHHQNKENFKNNATAAASTNGTKSRADLKSKGHGWQKSLRVIGFLMKFATG